MEHPHDLYETLSPHIPVASVFASIVLSALFPIFTGAQASLSRPASAAPPKKEKDDMSIEDEDEEEESLQPMESLSALDAVIFPVVAACVLATLYWLIKRYGAKVINLIMSWYLASAGVFSVIKLCSDGMTLVVALIFPPLYTQGGKLWTVQHQAKQTVFRASQSGETLERNSPLPGLFGLLPLPRPLCQLLWNMRSALKQKYHSEILVKDIIAAKGKITIIDMAAVLVGVAIVAYSNFVHNHWWLTNIQGFAVSYFALQVLSPTSFAIGSLVLSGLFVYDIWAVFFTPLMVTVATELDQPIKLVFPRYDIVQEGKAMQYSMLGLGDIVLPGLLIGLCLRFDLYLFYLRKQITTNEITVKAPYTSPRGHWSTWYWTGSFGRSDLPIAIRNASFPKPYFYASLTGYTIGLSVTLGVVAVYQHAQPALLYLVPAVLLSIWGTGACRGELKQLWAYSEELTGEAPPSELANNDIEKETATESSEKASWWQTLVSVFTGKDATELKKPKGESALHTEPRVSQSVSLEDEGTILKIVIRKEVARSQTSARGSVVANAESKDGIRQAGISTPDGVDAGSEKIAPS